jgi:hypothetical protein
VNESFASVQSFCPYTSFEAGIYAPGVRLHVGLPLSKTAALQVSLLSSIQVKVVPPMYSQHKIAHTHLKAPHLQLFTESGTQRPDWPLLKQTSSFKLVAATQQPPVGTGRLAFTPARSRRSTSRRTADAPGSSTAIAEAKATRAIKAVGMENFMLRLNE